MLQWNVMECYMNCWVVKGGVYSFSGFQSCYQRWNCHCIALQEQGQIDAIKPWCIYWKIHSNVFHYILDCNNNNRSPPSSNRFPIDVGEISILWFLLISSSPSCDLIELDRFKNLAQLGSHFYSSVQIALLQKVQKIKCKSFWNIFNFRRKEERKL